MDRVSRRRVANCSTKVSKEGSSANQLLASLGAGAQTREIYRFMPNGMREYIVLDAMANRAAVTSDPSATAGP